MSNENRPMCQHPACMCEAKAISQVVGGPYVCEQHLDWGFERLEEWEHDRYLYRCLLHDFTMEDSEAAQHSCDDYNEWQYIREEAK
jgi:hypothetical protein